MKKQESPGFIRGEVVKPECANCGRPSTQPVCHTCIDKLVRGLQGAPSDIADLEVAAIRQDKAARSRVGGRSAGTPSPFREDIMRVLDHADAVLGSWMRDLVDSHQVTMDRAGFEALRAEAAEARTAGLDRPVDPAALEQFPVRTAEIAAVWLAAHRTWIAAHPAVEELHDEITDALDAISAKMTRTETRWFGRCACGEDILGEHGDQLAKCRGCGTQYLADNLRTRMLSDARERLATGAEIRALIEQCTGERVPRGTWDAWVARKRIRARGAGLYRVGDALDLAERRRRSG